MNPEKSSILKVLSQRFPTNRIISLCENRVSLLNDSGQGEILENANAHLRNHGVLLLDAHQLLPPPKRFIAMSDIIASAYAFIAHAPNAKRMIMPVAGFFYHFPILRGLFDQLDGSDEFPLQAVPVYSSKRERDSRTFLGKVFRLMNDTNQSVLVNRNLQFHRLLREALEIPGTVVAMSPGAGLREVGHISVPTKVRNLICETTAPIYGSLSHLQNNRYVTGFAHFSLETANPEKVEVERQLNEMYLELHERIMGIR